MGRPAAGGDDADLWPATAWGGITRGSGFAGRDLRGTDSVEIWVNDGIPDRELRHGRLHIDLGWIDEDGFRPRAAGGDSLVTGTWEGEDGIIPGTVPDGIFSSTEDIGLDGLGCDGPQRYDPSTSTTAVPTRTSTARRATTVWIPRTWTATIG